MEKESLTLIKQLIASLEKKLEEMNVAMQEVDVERFNRIKQETYDLNKQIDDAIQ